MNLIRVFGTTAILIYALAFEVVNERDGPIIWKVSASHGIHTSDVVSAVIALVIWVGVVVRPGNGTNG